MSQAADTANTGNLNCIGRIPQRNWYCISQSILTIKVYAVQLIKGGGSGSGGGGGRMSGG